MLFHSINIAKIPGSSGIDEGMSYFLNKAAGAFFALAKGAAA
jgi:hypothetical protein